MPAVLTYMCFADLIAFCKIIVVLDNAYYGLGDRDDD